MEKLIYYKDIILTLTQKEIKVKYKSSFLGYLWSLLNSLSIAVIYYFAFKIFLKSQLKILHFSALSDGLVSRW